MKDKEILTNPAREGVHAGTGGAQTLLRGLTIIELIAEGVDDVKSLSQRLNLPRSTIHRVLNNLASAGYLHHVPYRGYTLGHKLVYLGTRAREQRPLGQLAHPFIEELANATGDTVHLGLVEGTKVFYLDKVSGGKGLEMRSRIGQRMPLASTGVGKALMLGMKPEQWKTLYDEAIRLKEESGSDRPLLKPWPEYMKTLQTYQKQGWVLDFEENELGIRCVGAPVYDGGGEVIAAISVASVIFYMPEERMYKLGPQVVETARKISEVFGAVSDK